MKGLAEAFADLIKLLKKFENMDPNTERFLLREMYMMHYLLTRKPKETNQANYHGHTSEQSNMASGRGHA